MGQEEEDRLAVMHKVHERLGVIVDYAKRGSNDKFGDNVIEELSNKLKEHWEFRDYARMLRDLEIAYWDIFHKWDYEYPHEKVYYDYSKGSSFRYYPLRMPDFGRSPRR